MSRNSKLKRDRKKKKQKGPGPGDRPSKQSLYSSESLEDTSRYSKVDNIKDPIKVDKSRNDAPQHPVIRRSGPRGG